jgi:hypothetical protein
MLNWLFRRNRRDGFHFKGYGRGGNIVYQEGQRSCKIEYEISGVPEYHILVFFDALKNWNTPGDIPISKEEKELIRNNLLEWLAKKKLKAQL